MLLIINNGIGFAIKRGEGGLAQPLVTFYRSVSKKKVNLRRQLSAFSPVDCARYWENELLVDACQPSV